MNLTLSAYQKVFHSILSCMESLICVLVESHKNMLHHGYCMLLILLYILLWLNYTVL